MSRNLRNVAVAFMQQVLGALGGVIGFFFITRQIPNSEFHLGVVGFALSFVGMFTAVQRAFDGAHVQRVSAGYPQDRCNSTYLILNILSTLAIVGLTLGFLLIWTKVLGRGFQTPLHVRALELIVLYHVLNSLGEFVRRMWEGQGNILVGQVILSTEHVIKTVAMVYVAFHGLEPVYGGLRNGVGLAWAYVIGAGGLSLVSLPFIAGQPFGKPSWSIAKSYARFGLPDTLTGSVQSVATGAYEVILQLFWGAGVVGLFFAPRRYTNLFPALAGAASTSYFPVFSSMDEAGAQASDALQRVTRFVSLLLLPMVAVTVALPAAIIHVLLSDDLIAGAPVMALLAIGSYILAVRKTLSAKVRGMDQPAQMTLAATYSMVATVVFGTVFVAPSLFGIPLLGLQATGAGIAFILANLVGFGHVLRVAKGYTTIELSRLWRHALMFAATVAGLWLMTLWVPQTSFRFYHLALAALLAPILCYGSGLLLGELHREDVKRAWRFMHPSAWLRFFREETRAHAEGENRND